MNSQRTLNGSITETFDSIDIVGDGIAVNDNFGTANQFLGKDALNQFVFKDLSLGTLITAGSLIDITGTNPETISVDLSEADTQTTMTSSEFFVLSNNKKITFTNYHSSLFNQASTLPITKITDGQGRLGYDLNLTGTAITTLGNDGDVSSGSDVNFIYLRHRDSGGNFTNRITNTKSFAGLALGEIGSLTNRALPENTDEMVVNTAGGDTRKITLGTLFGNIVPDSDNTLDIGSSSKKYANVFGTQFSGNSATATTATTATTASTATALATARNINGVSFNGTADITIGIGSTLTSNLDANTKNITNINNLQCNNDFTILDNAQTGNLFFADRSANTIEIPDSFNTGHLFKVDKTHSQVLVGNVDLLRVNDRAGTGYAIEYERDTPATSQETLTIKADIHFKNDSNTDVLFVDKSADTISFSKLGGNLDINNHSITNSGDFSIANGNITLTNGQLTLTNGDSILKKLEVKDDFKVLNSDDSANLLFIDKSADTLSITGATDFNSDVEILSSTGAYNIFEAHSSSATHTTPQNTLMIRGDMSFRSTGGTGDNIHISNGNSVDYHETTISYKTGVSRNTRMLIDTNTTDEIFHIQVKSRQNHNIFAISNNEGGVVGAPNDGFIQFTMGDGANFSAFRFDIFSKELLIKDTTGQTGLKIDLNKERGDVGYINFPSLASSGSTTGDLFRDSSGFLKVH